MASAIISRGAELHLLHTDVLSMIFCWPYYDVQARLDFLMFALTRSSNALSLTEAQVSTLISHGFQCSIAASDTQRLKPSCQRHSSTAHSCLDESSSNLLFLIQYSGLCLSCVRMGR